MKGIKADVGATYEMIGEIVKYNLLRSYVDRIPNPTNKEDPVISYWEVIESIEKEEWPQNLTRECYKIDLTGGWTIIIRYKQTIKTMFTKLRFFGKTILEHEHILKWTGELGFRRIELSLLEDSDLVTQVFGALCDKAPKTYIRMRYLSLDYDEESMSYTFFVDDIATICHDKGEDVYIPINNDNRLIR